MNIRRNDRALSMWWKLHNDQTCTTFLFKVKKRKKKNVTENENYEHETFIQRTQNDHDRDVYDINNKLVKSISSNEIIEKEKNFLLIKFSNEGFLSTWQSKRCISEIIVATSARRRRNYIKFA